MQSSAIEALWERLSRTLPQNQLLRGAPMSRFTTLRIGGPADLLCDVGSAEEISAALSAARELEVPVLVMGNGSNLLVRDGGVRGLVVRVADGFARVSGPVELDDGRFALTAQGGAGLTRLSNAAAAAGLAGLEFACGIPGTVGGAVYMNAGAYGGEMKDVVLRVALCGRDGRQTTLQNGDMAFGYRQSVLSQAAEPPVVTAVTVALRPGDGETIRATMRNLMNRRREKQPLALPSCGSTFKRPEGYFAGTLIDQCGLKGLRVGGASVSTLHAGFLVNDANATAAEYLALIAQVQRVVYEKTGVRLTPEVRVVGEEAPAALA